jgi:diadenosine tetraphosphate (Ap4A) HIT family hydrolase
MLSAPARRDRSWATCVSEGLRFVIIETENCPFCAPEPGRIIFETPWCVALWDAFPVSSHHALVVPRQHVANLGALESEAAQHLWSAVMETRRRLALIARPDGFNIGVNERAAGGQTIAHLHVHVIARFEGDVEDPRGGVRWVVPKKAVYW